MSDVDVEDSTILLTRKEISGDSGVVVVRRSNSRTGTSCPLTAVSPGHHVLLVSIVSLLGGLVLGYDLDLGHSLLVQMDTDFGLSQVKQYIFLFIWFIGAILSSLFGGILIDGCGRKWTILCTALLYIFSSIVTATSWSFSQLLCGRLLCGFASTLSSVAWSIYAAEMSGSQSRGRTVMCHRLGISLGLLIISIVAAKPDAKWQLVASLACIPAVIQAGVVFFYLPRSPHFSLLQISQSRRRIFCCSLSNLLEVILLGFAIVLILQFTGRISLMYYISHLSYVFGICSTHRAMISVILVFVQFVATCLVICIIDKIGRRLILLIGSSLMFICLLTLAITHHYGDLPTFQPNHCEEDRGHLQALQSAQYYDDSSSIDPLSSANTPPYPLLPTPLSLVSSQAESSQNIPPGYHYLAIVMVLGFQFSFWASVGAIGWILLTEIFPAATRGRCFALVTVHYWASEMLLSPTLNQAMSDIDFGKLIIIYCFSCFLTIIFIFLIIPETKGKSLHQIAQELKNTSPRTRMFQFLLEIPCLEENEYLQRKSKQYRPVNYSAVENTII